MRYRNKSVWRIPGGEIQYGHLSKTIIVWWRGRRLKRVTVLVWAGIIGAILAWLVTVL